MSCYGKCPDPVYDWWKSAKHCALVADPELYGAFNGTVYAQVRECGGTARSTVIDIDDDWLVDIRIETSGQLTDLICGKWCISICLESMCGGRAYRFPRDLPSERERYCCELVEIEQGKHEYSTDICVPGKVVKESECGAPYELTVIVTMLSDKQYKPGDPKDPGNYKPIGIAGACEVAHVLFYEGI